MESYHLKLNDSIGNISSSGNIIRSAPKDFKNIAHQGTVTSNGITIPKHGLYLVNFSLAHCGSNGITRVPNGWEVRLYVTSGQYISDYVGCRNVFVIPLGASWDSAVSINVIFELWSGIHRADFLNLTGLASSPEYPSRACIAAMYLPYSI